ncbi:MAG: DUF4340 domain-containing protein [Lachnospiraceae bacterium]|nr:DUF4340 domain-containing protein [Lachnospiraceae bacterium]
MAGRKKKNKKIVTLVILLLVFIALIAALIMLKKNPQGEDEQETTQSVSLENITDMVNSDLVEITYSDTSQSMTFLRGSTEENWVYAGDTSLGITQSAISTLAAAVTSSLVNQVIEEGLDNKANYGLDNPSYTVTVKDASGKTLTIYYGMETMTSKSYRYAYVEGDNRVITTDVTPIDKMSFDVYSMVDYEAFPALAQENMTVISYKDEDQSITLYNEPADLTIADAIGTTVWYYPMYGRYMACNYNSIVELLNAIEGLSYSGVAAFAPEDLSAYGLDADVATLEVTSKTTDSDGNVTETVVKLLIGGLSEDESSRYVMLEGDDNVYTMKADSFTVFTENILSDYLMSLGFALCNFDGITGIDVTYGDKSLNIEVTQGTATAEDGTVTTTYDCYVNGVATDETETRKLFANIIRPTADHILADGEAKEDSEVVYRCTYWTNYETLPEITYEFSVFDGTYYQVTLNGNTKYVITRQEFNTLISNIEAYLK